jgi:hypothetical protein
MPNGCRWAAVSITAVGITLLMVFRPPQSAGRRASLLTPEADSAVQFCLMSPPPRGKVHMATDIAHYEDLND